MVRDLMTHEGKIAPADSKATAACATGMGVVLNRAAKTFSLPSAATAENIFVVHKNRVPTGVYAGMTNFSDYFEQFNTVAVDEYAPLYMYEFGEVFATDQFDTTALTATTTACGVAVGTDGKWTTVSGTSKSKYRFVGMYDDAGHTLAKIEVLADAV